MQSKDWIAELERGYQTRSQKPLVAFLDAWHKSSKPAAPEILKKKLLFEQEVYRIFVALFKPDKQAYENAEFVIIQDKVDVVVVNSDLLAKFNRKYEKYAEHDDLDDEDWIQWRNDCWDRDLKDLAISTVVVNDFRPPVELEGKKVLYGRYEDIATLLGFFTHDKHGKLLSAEQYGKEECRSEERQSRLKYLNETLMIVPGHWGRGWLFKTYPTVTTIYFSSNLERAIVHYRAPYYRGGRALLEKNADGTWKIVTMKLIWME